MKKIFYEKIGRRYVPVSEYDSDMMDSFKKGTHLVMSYPGGKSFRYNVDPDYATMIAAGRVAEDVISAALMKAHEIRPYQNQALTSEQQVAWNNLMEVMGDEARYLEWPSAREVTQAAVEAMSAEAQKLLTVPAVKQAHEHFQFLATLTRDTTIDQNT